MRDSLQHYRHMCKHPIDSHTMAFITQKARTESEITKLIEAYEEDVDIYLKILSMISPGPARAAQAYRMIDREQNTFLQGMRRGGIVPACKEGCSNCCHMRVEVCSSEVDYIVETLKEKPMTICWDRLVTQAGKHVDDFYSSNMGEDNRCVLLGDDGLCMIYEARPSACREHLSVSGPEGCLMDQPRTHSSIYIETTRSISNALAILEEKSLTDLATALLLRKYEICRSM